MLGGRSAGLTLPHGDTTRVKVNGRWWCSLAVVRWSFHGAKPALAPPLPSHSAGVALSFDLSLGWLEKTVFAASRMPMAAHVASHLSHKSALALLPPSLIAPPIESIRRVHDKHFARWPPHINLIYPFLASPTEDAGQQGHVDGNQRLPRLKQDIRSRIQRAVRHVRPFRVALGADPPGIFSHNKRSKTVWLGPSPGAVEHLQAVLQAEFSECDSDTRPFVPHLSVGQARSDAGAQTLGEELKRSLSEHWNGASESKYQLDWFVDKVYVIERKGYHGRFEIVDAIELQEE